LYFAEGRFDKRAKVWVDQFRQLGTRWGVLRNLADIPYFASVKETRLLQVADFVSHSVFMLYERHKLLGFSSTLTRPTNESEPVAPGGTLNNRSNYAKP
jgi:hypothetical protein